MVTVKNKGDQEFLNLVSRICLNVQSEVLATLDIPLPWGGGLAEGISVKNKGDQEFSYLLFMTSRNVLGVVSDIFDWSANGFQQTTPQKPCLNCFPVFMIVLFWLQRQSLIMSIMLKINWKLYD